MSHECAECNALTRRNFLARSAATIGALSAADPLLHWVSRTYAQTSGGAGNILVLCQLNGGMDALSFLAPYTNTVYQARRPQLALAADEVFPLSGYAGFGINKQFAFFHDLWQLGQLAVVQQVAYPDGNGSHFESQEIYEFGVRDLSNPAARTTWYERLRRTYFDEPYGVMDTQTIGDPRKYGYPDKTYYRAAQEAFGRLARLKLARERSAAQQKVLSAYDRIDQLGEEIRSRTENFQSTGDATGEFFRAAALASAGLGTRILRLSYGGFDTHASQASTAASLFPKLDSHFRQFVGDMQMLGLWDRTVVVFYSEFGRRNEENGSPGTDHGHGGHMILAGPGVNGGLFGQPVSSSDLNQKNLPYYVDFRAVFSHTIQNWLGFNPAPIFNVGGETFDPALGGNLFR